MLMFALTRHLNRFHPGVSFFFPFVPLYLVTTVELRHCGSWKVTVSVVLLLTLKRTIEGASGAPGQGQRDLLTPMTVNEKAEKRGLKMCPTAADLSLNASKWDMDQTYPHPDQT